MQQSLKLEIWFTLTLIKISIKRKSSLFIIKIAKLLFILVRESCMGFFKGDNRDQISWLTIIDEIYKDPSIDCYTKKCK